MFIEKCDLCKKELAREKSVRVGDRGMFGQYSFCDECGAPVLVFLANLELVNKEKRV
jgi:hypothetical protein